MSETITDNQKRILIGLICKEQVDMMIKNHSNYESEEYKELEALKIRIKDM